MLAGLLLEHVAVLLCLAALGCLAWHLWQLYRLERWLVAGIDFRPPRHSIWYPVQHRCRLLRNRCRKRRQQFARIARQFKSAAAALPDGVVALNSHDEVSWCNQAAQQLLGLHAPHDYGQPITALVRHPHFVKLLTERNCLTGIEFSAPQHDKQRLSVRIAPYDHKRHLLLVTDITRVHRLEQTRRDFVANVSHELRTPLTVVTGYLETLQDSGDTCADRWQQPLRRMQEQARRMHDIIEDLLMLARLETEPDPQHQHPVDIPGMLEAIAEDARALSGSRQHQLRLAIDARLWLRGSEQELRSAFSNLVFNAVRYSPAGHDIVIRWHGDNSGAHLAVQDHGEGIAPHHIPRLTERFYRVDRSRKRESGGTGLGLAIVKHVLNRHRGQLRIHSELGVGSTFTCDFPPTQQIRRDLPDSPLQ